MVTTLSFFADAYLPAARHRAHRHDELHLSLVLSGRVSETVSGVTEYASALSVVAKDAGVVHADDFGPAGARIARLSLPAGTISALIDEPARSRSWRWTHDTAVAKPFLRLVRRAQRAESSFVADDPDLIDLLAAFTARRASTRGRPPAWLVQTTDELQSGWHPQLTVAAVARRAGVHPVYLARCVRRWYGTSVGDELRRLRIRSAVAALADSPGTISDVAHARGFSDEPHFCREVRRATGTTPGRYRALVGNLDYSWRGRR